MFDREVVCIVVAGYILDHYCFMFDRGVVHIVVAVILLTIVVVHIVVAYIVDRGEVHYCLIHV